jgi:hypothetical protein
VHHNFHDESVTDLDFEIVRFSTPARLLLTVKLPTTFALHLPLPPLVVSVSSL